MKQQGLFAWNIDGSSSNNVWGHKLLGHTSSWREINPWPSIGRIKKVRHYNIERTKNTHTSQTSFPSVERQASPSLGTVSSSRLIVDQLLLPCFFSKALSLLAWIFNEATRSFRLEHWWILVQQCVRA
jgi:hypothetical protein